MKIVRFRKPPRGQRSSKGLAVVVVLLALVASSIMDVPELFLKRPAVSPTVSPEEWYEIVSVYDGDTLTVRMPDQSGVLVKQRVRLLGIDTAELGGAKCDQEKALAEWQRDYLKSIAGRQVSLQVEGRDRYDRLLARVFNREGSDLSNLMLEFAKARPYGGGYRQGWCEQE